MMVKTGKMKKVTMVITLFIAFTFMVTACSGSKADQKTSNTQEKQAATAAAPAPASTAQSAEKKTTEKQKVIFIHWTAEANMEEPIKDFNSKNPDIEVVYQMEAENTTTGYNTMLMSGETIDVIGNATLDETRQRVQNGLFAPLNSYLKGMNSSIDDICEKSIADMEKYDGDNVYAIPYSLNTYGVIYNKSMFKDAGIPLPDDNWTWDDFRDAAKKLTKGEGPNKVYGYLPNYQRFWAWPAQLTLGSDAFYKSAKETNFDDPSFLQSLNLFYNMAVVDKSSWPLAEYQALNLNDNTTKMVTLCNKKVAMVIGSVYFVKYSTYPEAAWAKDFEIGVAPLPKLKKEGKIQSPHFFTDMSIPKNSKVKDAAWKWIKYFTIDRPDLCAGGKGQMPGTIIKDETLKKSFINLLYNFPSVDNAASQKVFMDDLGKFDLVSEYPVKITVANKELKDMAWGVVSRVLLGELKPEDAQKELKQKGDAILAQAK